MIRQIKELSTKMMLGAALVLLVAGLARATVYDLTNMAKSHGSIQYQWTFDTGADGGFRDARNGGVGLTNARSSPSYEATQVAGLDVSTMAMQTERPGSDRDIGAALRTASDISLPGTGTVEYIFKADATLGDGYIASGVVGASDRHYFGYDSSSRGGPVMGFGDPGQYQNFLGGSSGVTYTAGDWYYVAISYAPSGTDTEFNAYVANLSNDDTDTTQTISGWTPSGTAGGSMRFGIGCYGKGGDHYLDGSVDQVAIYSTVLAKTEIDDHVAVIYDEPDLRCDLSYPNYRNPAIDKQWMPDASSWNNDAVLGESSTTTAKDPNSAIYGFDFDPTGDGDELTLERNSSLRVADIGNNNDFSLEMWLRPDDIVQDRTLVDARTSGSNGWVMWMNEDGSLSLKFYQGGSGPGDSWRMDSAAGLLVAGDEQQHLVVSLDANASAGGLVSFYADGQPWGTDSYTGASSYVDPTTDPYRIGRQRNTGTTSLDPFDGEIGAFRLYAYALDLSEVQAHYTNEKHMFQTPEPATVVLLAFGGLLWLVATRRRKR